MPGTVFKELLPLVHYDCFVDERGSHFGRCIQNSTTKACREPSSGTGLCCAESPRKQAIRNYVSYTVPTRIQDLPQVDRAGAQQRRKYGAGTRRRAAWRRGTRLHPSPIIFAAVRCRPDRTLQCGAARSLRGVRCLARGRIFRNNRAPRDFRILAVSGRFPHRSVFRIVLACTAPCLPARLNSVGRQAFNSGPTQPPPPRFSRRNSCPFKASKREISPQTMRLPAGRLGVGKTADFSRMPATCHN